MSKVTLKLQTFSLHQLRACVARLEVQVIYETPRKVCLKVLYNTHLSNVDFHS